jgi:hypothetical protein
MNMMMSTTRMMSKDTLRCCTVHQFVLIHDASIGVDPYPIHRRAPCCQIERVEIANCSGKMGMCVWIGFRDAEQP